MDASLCRKQLKDAGVKFFLVLAASLMVSPAEAGHRRWHRHIGLSAHHEGHRTHQAVLRHHSIPSAATPSSIAAIVVDGNSGRTLYAHNENEWRFPASITKVMTLYLLFDEIEKGRLRLDSKIPISFHAAAQKPTKLGLKPGETIAVEDAIKAVVTRSANDMAVAIAEAIGGNEAHFADIMTEKAHVLGMNDTHFANASGLPHPEQLTTAHDLAILGMAIQERFPRYYHYFSTRSFYYAGHAIANHNHLLGRIEGMDGIKTGYTQASGFNLLSSVKRNGHYIVAVVLGGRSAPARDRIMADLIEDEIEKGSTLHTASAMAPSLNAMDEEEDSPRHAADRKLDSPVRTDSQLAYAPMPPKLNPDLDPIRLALLKDDSPTSKVKAAFISGGSKPPANLSPDELVENRREQANPTSTASPYGTLVRIASGRPILAHNGWMIQVGATPDIEKATELLLRAKSESHELLTSAHAFTEKVQKGSATLYRARFAGLEADRAELACKTLKRSGFSCFATKD